MADNPITYEQLKVMMEIQSKDTEQMVLVADRLKEIAEILKDLAPKIAVTEENKKTLAEIKVKTDTIQEKTNTLLIIYGALTGLVAIAFLIVQVVNWSDSRKSKTELSTQMTKIEKEGYDRGQLQTEIKNIIQQMQSNK